MACRTGTALSRGRSDGANGMTKYLELSPDTVFLLVDEAQSVRDTIHMALKAMGLRNVVQCGDALTALSYLREQRITFIICDRSLRGLSGMELLNEIREDPMINHVPFLMMASEVTKDDVLLAYEFGIDGYLQKPFALRDVSAKITASLARYQDPNNPERAFETARKLMSQGKYQESINEFAILRDRFPDSARAHVGIARALRAVGEIGLAIDELREAIRKNPLYVHAHHEMGVAELENENVEGAIVAFDSAIKASPLNPVRYEAIADLLMGVKNYPHAEDYLMRAIKLELVYPNIFSQLGKCLFVQKKMEKAIKYFEQAIVYQPTNTRFLNSLGICLKEIGKYEDALKYYNTALKYSQSDTKILFNKALCLIQMSEYERARKTLLQILALEPNYSKATEKMEYLDKIEKSSRAG